MTGALGDCDLLGDQRACLAHNDEVTLGVNGVPSSLSEPTVLEGRSGLNVEKINEPLQNSLSGTAQGPIKWIPAASKPTATIALPRRTKKPASIRTDTASSDEEPLVDTTAALALHSKKTARLQRRHQKKQSARKVHSDIQSLLDFPSELLLLMLSFLQPSDIYSLLRLNRSMRRFILDNETAIADSIMYRRYWVLRQCFPLPVMLDRVSDAARPALLSQQWQDRLKIHKNPYQHIKQIDPSFVCTCMSCVLAWNNLCIILDLAHWQPNFDNREPLPIIPRGRNPEWNVQLLEKNAQIVTKAMQSSLTHARILQKHLAVTTRTILRSGRWRRKGDKTTPAPSQRPRLYHLTDEEAAAGTDEFLERSGPPSYQPIYMRDNYYSVEAFVPNRKWDRDEQRWQYYSKWPKPHENDLAWLVARFTPSE
ncbi:hypothetical protein A1O3_03463 [Capronia epimyces CBS 606.96]|uniref:F-box domain-containing protein n=1 Tax=Capronia epimyces CBS 606.96 TaxID=1182542 RepID=W9Y131_9EURO|nr:uncharacterized protein A1O3_03463 [Capronia epimyces CBS 606.96]EXJ86512.1 hypothetical protein A1O3_03463 [Capronia epimyces CBS 606.96]